jgi:hypothetical protein
MKKMKFLIFTAICALILSNCNGFHKTSDFNRTLLCDDFSDLDTGLFSAPVGPLTEYHYLPEAGKKGNWEVACFGSAGGMRKTGWAIAWQVKTDDSQKVMCQTFSNKEYGRTHPIIVAGDSLWRDYKLTVVFCPEMILYCQELPSDTETPVNFIFSGSKILWRIFRNLIMGQVLEF